MTRPLAIDLYCGLGGWTEGFLAEGYECVGFDIERHVYGEHRYPAQLVLQDVLTIHGSQFRDAALIVASPPCQRYSYMAMPWKRSKALIAWYEDAEHPGRRADLNALFNACFRIQAEASAAAGRRIPLVVENVRGAQRWVGPARWHYGSYYLWGDVPALMPVVGNSRMKFPSSCSPRRWDEREVPRLQDGTLPVESYAFHLPRRDGTKVGGLDWNRRIPGQAFNTHAERAAKRDGASAPRVGRKAAAAHIAKIPPALAEHIAHVYYPRMAQDGAA